MFEQLTIHLETNGGDVAALFGAEQIARATNFQIAHRDFEAAAEAGILFNGANAFARLGEQRGVARQQNICVRLMLVTAHAAA